MSIDPMFREDRDYYSAAFSVTFRSDPGEP